MKYQKRQVKTAASDYEVLSSTLAKVYLRETGTAQDTVITALINSAEADIEQALDFFIDTSSLIYQYYDSFPDEDFIPIWHRYITTTSFVVEYWNGSAWTAVSSSDYRIDVASVPPRAVLVDGASWPTLTLSDLNAVRIGFKVDTGASFFAALKTAVMTLVAARYENREMSEMPSIVKSFIEKHRMPSV